MKKILVILAALGASAAQANIKISIEEITQVVKQAERAIGMGYTIQSVSRTYSQTNGHGYELVVYSTLGVGNPPECYEVFESQAVRTSYKIYEYNRVACQN